MGLQPQRPTMKGPADWFTGDVYIDSIVQPQDDSTLNIGTVHHTPAPAPPRGSGQTRADATWSD